MPEAIDPPAAVGCSPYHKLYEAFAERQHIDTQLKHGFRSQARAAGEKIKTLNEKEGDMLRMHALAGAICASLAGIAGITGGVGAAVGSASGWTDSAVKSFGDAFKSISDLSSGINGASNPLFDSLTKEHTHEAAYLRESLQEMAQTGGNTISRAIETDTQVQMQIQTKA